MAERRAKPYWPEQISSRAFSRTTSSREPTHAPQRRIGGLMGYGIEEGTDSGITDLMDFWNSWIPEVREKIMSLRTPPEHRPELKGRAPVFARRSSGFS